MEIFGAVLLVSTIIVGAYALVFGFLGRVNDWYYTAGKLRLPPGDMGWPFIGAMPSFLSSFKSHPDSFLSNLISRSLQLINYAQVLSPLTCTFLSC